MILSRVLFYLYIKKAIMSLRTQFVLTTNEDHQCSFIVQASHTNLLNINIKINIIDTNLFYQIEELEHNFCLQDFNYKVIKSHNSSYKIIFSSQLGEEISFILSQTSVNRLMACKIFKTKIY